MECTRASLDRSEETKSEEEDDSEMKESGEQGIANKKQRGK